MEKIQLGKHVQLAYDIFINDGQAETSVFKFTADQPDCFVFGLDPGMIEGFMKGIEGLTAGEKFDFALDPEQAFGMKDPSMVIEFSRDTFNNADGEFDDEVVQVGAIIPMRTQEGYRLDGKVESITEDKVVLDFNHQLAGERVRYVGEVIAVRDATPDELNPAPHGCGGCGHDHGGCSCGDCGGSCC